MRSVNLILLTTCEFLIQDFPRLNVICIAPIEGNVFDSFAPCGLVIRIGKVNGEEVLRNLNFIHTVQIMDLVTGTKRLLSFGVA